MQVTERRSDTRAPVSLMGAMRLDDDETPAIILDLSPSGVRFQVDSPPDPRHEYQLHFNVHSMACSPRLRVVHWNGSAGAYRWGCTFFDLPDDQRDSLRRIVQAASGAAGLTVREWAEVLAAASIEPDGQILVGFTPCGREITLLGQDCVETGQDGVELFVRTVAGLESA
ncbi:MAG TPA: PilZ domain-containing protein [Chloroflexota bacterium]